MDWSLIFESAIKAAVNREAMVFALAAVGLNLHFGFTGLLTAFWNALGRAVRPLFDQPVYATSLSDWWGKRWNLSVHMVLTLAIWQPLRERIGARWRPNRSVVQRWMDIRSPNGGVYDIRALLQRNERGEWQLTAMAVRESEAGRIASNVSAGGAARGVRPYLAALYGKDAGERIAAAAAEAAEGLPAALEAAYGRRFAELGIDFAVERGIVRIIEVNAKPGKKIVRALSGERAYADAVLLPIRFAFWLSDRGCRTLGSL